MNLWAAIVVGLGSGLFGTLATLSYEREAEFRRRMAAAADDYIALAMGLVHSIRDAHTQMEMGIQGLSAGPLDAEPLDDRMARVFNDIDKMTLLLARIGLLFGTGRSADAAAMVAEAVDEARNALYAERTDYQQRAPATVAAGKHTEASVAEVLNGVIVFTQIARDDVRGDRFKQLIRRRLHRSGAH
jgi:hypothetical protein